jgi:hypothetical protein
MLTRGAQSSCRSVSSLAIFFRLPACDRDGRAAARSNHYGTLRDTDPLWFCAFAREPERRTSSATRPSLSSAPAA